MERIEKENNVEIKPRIQLTLLDADAENLHNRTADNGESYVGRVRRALGLLDAIEDDVESVYDSLAETTYTVSRTRKPVRSI